jgi:iron complex outermembrane receptor protein
MIVGLRIVLFCGAILCASVTAGAREAVLDTTVTELGDMVVSGQEPPTTAPDRTRIDAPTIQVQDPGSLADVGALIPSARVSTNSRGDSHLMIRGAPERHVQTFIDDIPLNLPWDERVDLQTIPITGAATLTGTRGLTTLMDGPGVLAGSVRILPPAAVAGTETRLSLGLGEHGRSRADVQHQDRLGAWDMLGAAGWQSWDAWPVPGDVAGAAANSLRDNSDLSQFSLLVRGSRPVAGTGRLNLLATGWTAEKGVPPELHLGDEARFWRYPTRKRALLGASLDLPLDDDAKWDLQAALSADYFEQEIDPRGPDGWDQPLIPGQDYEWDRDRTGYGKARVTRWLGDTASLAVQATGRYTHHTETLTVGGPANAYSQWLTSLVAETEIRHRDIWVVRAGLGWDHAATPEAGDKTAQAGSGAPAVNLRLTREFGARSRVFAAVSRRSRFASLRELYSGALGRFVPNPDLRPERQDLFEAGWSASPGEWQLEAGVFVGYLRDGIERVALPGPDRQYRRVNRTEIRVPGLELVVRRQIAPDLSLDLQHTVMQARVKEDDAFDRPAEDRPDYLSRAGLQWRPPQGPGALCEALITGARWSADTSGASGATDDLRRLPAGVTWNLRLSWRFLHPDTAIDLYARVDNLFDQLVEYQVGLPNPGRIFTMGAAIDF